MIEFNSVARWRMSDSMSGLEGRCILMTGVDARTLPAARAILSRLEGLSCRLVLQVDGADAGLDRLCDLARYVAKETRVFRDRPLGDDATTRFAAHAIQVLGGVDVVINLAALKGAEAEAGGDEVVVAPLRALLLTTRVVANRFKLTRARGTIVNVLLAGPLAGAEALAAALSRAELEAVTRREAHALAEHGIVVSAVVPDTGSALPGLGARADEPEDLVAEDGTCRPLAGVAGVARAVSLLAGGGRLSGLALTVDGAMLADVSAVTPERSRHDQPVEVR